MVDQEKEIIYDSVADVDYLQELAMEVIYRME